LFRVRCHLGNVTIASGLSVLIGAGPWTAVLAILLTLHYDRVVRAEERMLELRFGERYRVYRRQVRRWWPVRRDARQGMLETLSSVRREWRVITLALLCATVAVALRV
jgi:hypothetical protein